ncbi:hypothetical protein WH52_02730, partial [Tenacibaculum holothuriorum]
MINLYNATDGDNWTNNTNWDIDPNSTSDVSTWHGITTEVINGQKHVSRIDLVGNNLIGDIPDFSKLTNLYRLELAANQITGTIDVSKLPNTLQVLQLSTNKLSGSYPDLSSLTNLLHIQLSRNNLSGNISKDFFPTTIQTISLGYGSGNITGQLDFENFPDLRTLIFAETDISFVKFPSNGIMSSVFNSNTSFSLKNMQNLAYIEVPNVTGFTNLNGDYFDLGLRIVAYDQADKNAVPNIAEREALKKFFVNDNYTYASTIKNGSNDTEWLEIESINGEARVTEMHISNRNIGGNMPTEIGVFTELKHLFLPSYGLQSIAAEIGNANKLEELYLNNNSINSVPTEVYGLTNLRILNLSNNQIPTLQNGLGDLTNLEELYFNNTQVDVIPTTIGNLKKLETLEFGSTRITLLPPEIGGLTELTRLVAAPNNIASIPNEFGQLTKLTFLDFANCKISNTPAAFANLTNLETLYLNNNELQVVAGLGGFTKLRYLRLHNNRLGEDNPNFNTDLPEDMSNLVLLEELTLYSNKLTKLPVNIGNLINLEELRIESNRLTSIPSTIGSLNIYTLNLQSNSLSTLPDELTNISS